MGKCSETAGDPHNANRGFFFAHMGWLMVRKHPAVMKAGKTINMSDLEADPLLMFQHRNYMFGLKPYDENIGPAENRLVSVLAMGEGFHNYHHTFPYDYSTSEWGLRLNVTTRFINAMAKLGFAYDLRTAS